MKTLLLACYWIGIVADAGAAILLFSPAVASVVLQPQPFEMSEVYLYVARVAGGLMAGWTVLLFWAQLKPIERADVLLITLLPVIAVLAIAAILVVRSHQIPLSSMLPILVFYAIALVMFIPSYLWARRQRGATGTSKSG
jgi:hypothetical protein